MKKLFLFLSLLLSLTLVLSSCDNKKKHHDDDDDSEESESSSKKSKSKKSKSDSEDDEEISYEEAARADSRDAATYDAAPSEPQSRYDSPEKHAQIEQWLSVVAKRNLTENDLVGLSTDDVVLIKNLIYANHNYRFKQSRFLYFFSQYPWYQPIYDKDTDAYRTFNKYERYNATFLLNHE